jgi:hypothetical protein
MTDSDPSLLDFSPTLDEAQGKKELVPTGFYQNVLIDDITAYAPDPESPYFDENEVARYQFKFVCPDKDVDLTKFIKRSKKMGPRSGLRALWSAAIQEGEAKELDEETIAARMSESNLKDLIGRRVNIFVSHEPSPNGKGKYAAYAYTPCLKQ